MQSGICNLTPNYCVVRNYALDQQAYAHSMAFSDHVGSQEKELDTTEFLPVEVNYRKKEDR